MRMNKLVAILILCTIIILAGCVVQSPYTDCKSDCKIMYYENWCNNKTFDYTPVTRYGCPFGVNLPDKEANKYCYEECK